MLHVKYAMNYHLKNSFSMSYASRKVIFPGVDSTEGKSELCLEMMND